MRSSRIPPSLRSHPFRGSDAVSAGLVSRRRLLGAEFRRVLHGVYVPAGITIDHGVRCQAAALVLPPQSLLTGHSAAWWYGVELARNDAIVMVARPPAARIDGPRGIKVHRTPVQPGDVAVVQGMRVTSPVRAAWDVATLAESPTALVIVDGLLRRGVLTSNELDARLSMSAGAWGVSRAREVFRLADGRAESPSETQTRFIIHRAGLPAPVLQYEVRVDGQFVARVDFAWPGQRVILEYDGAHHADPLQMRRDRRRLNDLVSAGWVVLHATASDLRDPRALLNTLRTALSRPAA